MNPTLYDILGVAPDASREQIRQAWRDAADRFEPGEGSSTRQFRLFNEAAEVLLDPESRAAYDAELVRPSAADTVPEPDESGTAPSATRTPRVVDVPTGSDRDRSRWPLIGGRRPVLAALGVLTAAAVSVAAFLTVQAERVEAYEQALERAPEAAENAAVAVLSYDHESLEADRDAAAKFLTPDYRDEYVDTFDKLVVESATETKARVEAEVLASSAMTSGGDRDPERVRVLVFVNQATTNAATDGAPSVALNRVRMDMVEHDGSWLVDGITSY